MQIQKANKAQKKLRIALFGESGHGKTHSAILMARACGERVLVLDSEDGASHSFSDVAPFNVLKLDDVTIEGYSKALDLAIREHGNYDVVIIDSLSHAWQSALAEVEQAKSKQLGWGNVTPRWDGLIHKIKRLDCHVFVTMRSKTRQDGNRWVVTYDSRENTDYDFDLILHMAGVKNVEDKLTATAKVTKNRFNTGIDRLNVGGTVNVGASLVKFILDWQAKTEGQGE